VTVVSNGLEAFNAVKQKRFDVVLMDVQMPVMGGFEATKEIRLYEKEQGLSRTPIIALTAHAMLGDREKCIQAQMDEYLSKPLKQNVLMQTILKVASDSITKIFNKHGRTISTATTVSAEPNASAPETPESSALLRPAFNERSVTTTGPVNHGSVESPSTSADTQPDPMASLAGVSVASTRCVWETDEPFWRCCYGRTALDYSPD